MCTHVHDFEKVSPKFGFLWDFFQDMEGWGDMQGATGGWGDMQGAAGGGGRPGEGYY